MELFLPNVRKIPGPQNNPNKYKQNIEVYTIVVVKYPFFWLLISQIHQTGFLWNSNSNLNLDTEGDIGL